MNKLLILILLCFSFNAYSEQKFNPYNNEWETVSPDAELKYNPFSNSHEYVPPDAVPRFNAYSGEYEMASPDASAKYNPYKNEYEMVPDNFEPTYNPFSENTKWHLEEQRQSLIRITVNGSLLSEESSC